MNFPKQNHKIPLSKFAEKYGISRQTAQKIAKSFGSVKPREQYEADAQKRREIAYNLRKDGYKFREIAEMLGISTNNAQQLVRRYQHDS